jgi:two-component system chemotaxis response regulator CheV
MSGVLSSVDARTKLVGQNRLELLMFNLGGSQAFAINVFKVQEVMRLPKLTPLPASHPVVKGVTHLRGHTLPVVDLKEAIGMGTLRIQESSNIIVTEYNRTVQAFLVGNVERIVNMNWEEILPPPNGAGRSHYLTAITRVEERITEIIDVEKILSEISPYNAHVSDSIIDKDLAGTIQGKKVLVVDDSSVARNQVAGALEDLGLSVVKANNGALGLQILLNAAETFEDVSQEFVLVITDAEMPSMDGYKLTTEIRKHERLRNLYVMLHTSLSGSFNEQMVKKVGCDDFLSKFQPDLLAKKVQEALKNRLG